MHTGLAYHRLPRAGIDTIDAPGRALHAIAMSMAIPPRPETLVILLDEARRGLTIVTVTDCTDPDHVVDAIEVLTAPANTQGVIGAIIVASIRPDGATDERDVDRWIELSEIAEAHGVQLLEWYVVGREIVCPRDLLGEPPRWGT